MRIQVLRPRVGLEAASERFFYSGWRRVFQPRRQGTLAEFYVPYFVFTVYADVNTRSERSFWAIDGRDGKLQTISLPRVPEASELVELETTNCLDFSLDEVHARAILQEHVRSLYLSKYGPLALRQFSLTVAVPALRLHWPYWVVSIEQGSKPRIEALDAIYGEAQDQKWKDAVLGRWRIRSGPVVGRAR